MNSWRRRWPLIWRRRPLPSGRTNFPQTQKKLSLPHLNWQNTNAEESRHGAMGRTKGLNVAEFEVGSEVRIADRSFLESFLEAGQYHNELEPEQLAYAGKIAKVKAVDFFTGGDEIYTLQGIPGVWHEECLSAA